MKPELMDAPMVNMINGGHYYMGTDSSFGANEAWTRVSGLTSSIATVLRTPYRSTLTANALSRMRKLRPPPKRRPGLQLVHQR